MGLQKFQGDDRVATKEELIAWFEAIREVNVDIHTVCVCVTPREQIDLVMQIMRRIGFVDTEMMVFHKQFKSDKARTGGFISSCLYAVVGYKDKAYVWSSVSFPENSVERLSWAQNLWTLYKPTPAVEDQKKRKLNECPQDPLIPTRFIQMFRQAFGPDMVVFSHGESTGWVAPVCQTLGVNCICTEPNPVYYGYLLQRVLDNAGSLLFKEGAEQEYRRRVFAYINKTKKTDEVAQSKAQAILDIVEKVVYFNKWIAVWLVVSSTLLQMTPR